MIKRPPIFSTPKAEILDFLTRTPDWQLQQRSGQCRRHERTPRKRRGLPRQKISPTAEAGSQESGLGPPGPRAGRLVTVPAQGLIHPATGEQGDLKLRIALDLPEGARNLTKEHKNILRSMFAAAAAKRTR